MYNSSVKPVLGVLGGMGVLASSEFVQTIYDYNTHENEQECPPVILYSDPTFPDRTNALLSNSDGRLVDLLARRLEQFYELGADKVVLCCVTLHYLLPRMPANLKRGLISLVDVALSNAAESRRRQLLLCSTGAREARLFQSHERWGQAADYIVWPDAEDQAFIHTLLYQYKIMNGQQPFLPHLKRLLDKYRVDSFIAGCSELHMLTKHLLKSEERYCFIDPLMIIAEQLPVFLQAECSSRGSVRSNACRL